MNNEKSPSEISDMYRRLGIKKGATYDEVKEAYRKSALYWHPDRNTDKEKSHLEFIAVSEAFEILSDKLNKKKPKDTEYSDKEKGYDYYEELFKEIFSNDEYLKYLSPQLRTIIEMFKIFKL